MPTESNDKIIEKLKSYFFQPLLTLLVGIATFYISQMRSDIQQALIQVNIDKTRIDNLERIVYTNSKSSSITLDSSEGELAKNTQTFFKHEEEFDIKKYLPPKQRRTTL